MNLILDTGFFLWGPFVALSGAVTWSVIRQVFIYPPLSAEIDTITSGTPGLETVIGSQTSLTPRTFEFSQEQLMRIQNYSEQGVQTESSVPSYIDQGIQASDFMSRYNPESHARNIEEIANNLNSISQGMNRIHARQDFLTHEMYNIAQLAEKSSWLNEHVDTVVTLADIMALSAM